MSPKDLLTLDWLHRLPPLGPPLARITADRESLSAVTKFLMTLSLSLLSPRLKNISECIIRQLHLVSTSPVAGVSAPGVSLHLFSFKPLFYHSGPVTPGEDNLHMSMGC